MDITSLQTAPQAAAPAAAPIPAEQQAENRKPLKPRPRQPICCLEAVITMASSGHEAYVAEKILSADPVELIRILYGAGIGSVEAARRHLAAGAIPARSAA